MHVVCYRSKRVQKGLVEISRHDFGVVILEGIVNVQEPWFEPDFSVRVLPIYCTVQYLQFVNLDDRRKPGITGLSSADYRILASPSFCTRPRPNSVHY